MPATSTHFRGATIVLMLEAVGDPVMLSSVAATSAVLKPAIALGGVPGPTIAPVATFAVTARAEGQGIGAGFTFTLAAPDCAALEPGTYVTTPEIVLTGGAVVIGEPLFVRIEQSTVS